MVVCKMKILVGSKNPVKVDAVKEAFKKYFDDFEVEGFSVDSNVPDQPINDDTFHGAKNRAEKLFELNKLQKLNAEYFVGIEGGIIQLYNNWFGFGCMCVIDKEKHIGFGTSPLFPLPEFVTIKLLEGMELGDVIDQLTNKENTKHNEGAIGFFTNNVMKRKDLYVHGITTALIPFIKKSIFKTEYDR